MSLDMLRSHFDDDFFKKSYEGISDARSNDGFSEKNTTHEVIDLPIKNAFAEKIKIPFIEVIEKRKTIRQYSEESLSLNDLSFLLWATQGIRETADYKGSRKKFRMVPSGGCSHSLETYLIVSRIDTLRSGVYRYLVDTNQLMLVSDKSADAFAECVLMQNKSLTKNAAVTFVWVAKPANVVKKFRDESAKLIAQDSGHLCQNLYLAATAIGAGVCAIGAYKQDDVDDYLGVVGGTDEFAVYMAAVGKVK